MAGSGIRGQFEEKFKALIRDIEEEVCLLCQTDQYILVYMILLVGRERDLFHRRSP